MQPCSSVSSTNYCAQCPSSVPRNTIYNVILTYPPSNKPEANGTYRLSPNHAQVPQFGRSNSCTSACVRVKTYSGPGRPYAFSRIP